MMPTISAAVSSKRVAITLLLGTGLLLAAHCGVNVFRAVTGHDYVFGLIPMFDFFEEGNLPTAYSTALLGGASFLLFLVYLTIRNKKDRFAGRWALLSFVFLFLAVDEAAELHEQLSRPVQQATGILPGSFEYWGWTVPYLLLTALLGVYMLPFLFDLPPRFRRLFVGAAALFVSGAIGFEVLEGVHGIGLVGQTSIEHARLVPAYVVMVTFEELLEMGGVILFIYSLLEYLRTKSAGILLTYEP